MYNTILGRSFSRHEQKKLGYGAFIGFLLITLSFCTVFRPYLESLPVMNLRLSMGVGLKTLMVKHTDTSHQQVIRVPAENDTETAVPEKDDFQTPVPAKAYIETEIPATDDGKTEVPAKNDDIKAEIPEKIEIKAEIPTKNDPEVEIPPKDDHIKPELPPTDDVKIEVPSEDDVKTKVPEKIDIKLAEVPAKNDTKDAEVVVQKQKLELVCNTAEPDSDFCDINNGDIRIDGNSSTVYITASSEMDTLAGNSSWTIKPHARKFDIVAMSHVRQWTVQTVPTNHEVPLCTFNHSVPAIIFSLAGYVGNYFHAFTDAIVPLYLTSRQFNREVKFLVTNNQPYWIEKFREILKGLSKYEIIDIDKADQDQVHCFPHVIVGLKRHREFGIDPSRSPYSMEDFREFLRSSYSLNRATAIKIRDNGEGRKPRILIVSRKRKRCLTNEHQIVKMAKRLGYDVVLTDAEDMKVSRFAQIVNSCDVLMGVHGAGLTNIVFLPENAVFIQVVPFGNMEWVVTTSFGDPARNMKLRYLEYKIRKEESTLMQQYSLDDDVLRDPNSIHKQGWTAFASVYLEKQNVKIDVRRFRHTLVKALELLHQ